MLRHNGDNLSALKIDRSAATTRKRPWLSSRWLIALVLLIVGIGFWLRHSGKITVESTGVTSAYPYQGVTQLNATGYVVAQRKAAVASKATGRLEWLGVQEGSVVKAGDVIARLESADVVATSEQTAANVQAAKAELEDARVDLERAQDLAAKKFVSGSVLDQSLARFDKAKAGLAVAAANRKGSDVAVDYTRFVRPSMACAARLNIVAAPRSA